LRNSNGIISKWSAKWSRINLPIFDQYLAISQKWCKMGTYLLCKAKENSYALYEMVLSNDLELPLSRSYPKSSNFLHFSSRFYLCRGLTGGDKFRVKFRRFLRIRHTARNKLKLFFTCHRASRGPSAMAEHITFLVVCYTVVCWRQYKPKWGGGGCVSVIIRLTDVGVDANKLPLSLRVKVDEKHTDAHHSSPLTSLSVVLFVSVCFVASSYGPNNPTVRTRGRRAMYDGFYFFLICFVSEAVR